MIDQDMVIDDDTTSGYGLLFMGLALGAALGILVAPSLGLGIPHWTGAQ